MRSRSRYRRIEFLTVRDDAPVPVRQKATEELRATVSRAASDGGRALVVPLLLSYGGIEERIRGRLAGLEFSMPAAALLPDHRIVEWVIERFREAPQDEGGSR